MKGLFGQAKNISGMKNQIYHVIEAAIRNHVAVLPLDEAVTADDIRQAVRWVMRDNPDIFWFSHQYEYDSNEAAVRLAQAAVELAQLNLSYTVIVATCDGVTGKKDIHEGQLVQPGQTMVDIVDGSDLWVIANYRETQLPNIKEGYKVTLTADAVPGVTYTGVVESISDATGAAFSLIPQDNATGNFVKVEQRVPVRISLKENSADKLKLLRAGFNVECKVKY